MTEAVTSDGWSAYDDAVPHPTDLPEVVERVADLRELRHPPGDASLTDVRQVVVVVSSSRGGSSLFGQVLRQVPGLLHLRAEVNPLFTLAGLHEGADRRRVLEDELLRDIGTPGTPGPLEAAERERLVLDLAWRLTVQWPALTETVSLADLLESVEKAVPEAGWPYDATGVHLSLLEDLRRAGAAVHPGYYDLDCLEPAVGPPGEAVIEMPPFVAIGQWREASAAELRALPLVVCTPRCSFRLEFLRDLFPAADLRVVHLTRNPAASVNGLIDGWLHHGFFNSPVPGGLAIDGYSDQVAGGTDWWCYDFPPGWEQWTSSPLEQVCAFQWRATHRAAQEGCDRLGIEPLRVRFEDVVGPPDARMRVGCALAALLGVGRQALEGALLAELPVVMATAQPRPARWRGRGDALQEVLRDHEILEMAHCLGYDRSGAGWV